jgi:hypothetical protein
VHLLKGGLPKVQTPNIWFSEPIPPFTLWPVPYIILLFVNFTTLPYFAYTGEHLVKIQCSSDFPQNAKKGVCVPFKASVSNYVPLSSLSDFF